MTFRLCLAVLLLGATPLPGLTAATAPLVDPDDPPSFIYPQRREVDGAMLVLHAPQIREWPEFAHFEAAMAMELTPAGADSPVYATATVSGETSVDLARRIVDVMTPRIERVVFSDPDDQRYEELVMGVVTRKKLEFPMDYFLAYLAEDVLSDPPPPGFNMEPPTIVFRTRPSLLLFLNGEPVRRDVPETPIQEIVNANWPLFFHADDATFYLLDRNRWLTSSLIDDGWETTTSLPLEFAQLAEREEYATVRAALPPRQTDEPVPDIVYAATPTELIVIKGEPELEEIEGADGLVYVSNTESPLFALDDTWYFLVSGRWFSTSDPETGPWAYESELPDAFAAIPEDHAMADVRASVRGTVEARMAALEALIPVENSVAKGQAAAVEVTYAGDPEFEVIPGMEVARAVNTGFDVLTLEGRYYLCHGGAWYLGESPNGPWIVTDTIPAVFYDIPPSSPAYPVTQVAVADSSSEYVTYTYPQSYDQNVYVVYGTTYYGTGWYYPPYIWGYYYYPYYPSYGHGSWYNPNTGRYGSRSVWVGPYGGYSYNRAYNPDTGRYGYVETAWDGDEWASYGESYNPRTGTYTETSRYYDEDDNRAEMERTVERGDKSVSTEREIDFDDGTAEIRRETSAGGQSEMTRQREGDTIYSSGTITSRDGETYTVEGEQTREGGTTTITGDERSAELTTKRNDGRSVTKIEGSEGGQGVSFSGQGPGRTTIVESGSGDLYAGHDGNVYKKTDDGWQKREGGEWSAAEPGGSAAAERREAMSANREAGTSLSQRSDYDRYRNYQQRDYGQYGNRNFSQLDRDHSARLRGRQSFNRRGFGGQRGMGRMRSGGFRRRR